MTLLASRRGRMFLTSALVAILSIALATYLVNVRVTREAEHSLRQDILATDALAEQLRSTRIQTLTTLARLIADSSKLKAAAATSDSQHVQAAVTDIRRQVTLVLNLFLVTDASGGVLAVFGASARPADIVAHQPAVRAALAGRESVSLLPQTHGMLQLVTVPIAAAAGRPDILGTLSLGFLLDDGFSAQLKAMTGSDVAFGMDGQILATTLPHDARAALALLLRDPDTVHDVRIGVEDYAVLPRRLGTPADTDGTATGPVALILRSRSEQLGALQAIHTVLGATAVAAVLVVTLLGFAVARTSSESGT